MIPLRALVPLAALFSSIALAQPMNPGKEWEYAKPEDHGYSSKRLGALKGYLATIDTTAMIVVHKGKVIFEYGEVTRQGMVTSARKSLLSLLYGKYVASGKINLDSTLEQLGVDDLGALLPSEKRATVRDLLTARSGVYHKSDTGSSNYFAPPRGSQQPGAYFLYNGWDFNAASHIFEKLTGIEVYDALQKDLAEPLGMQDFDRTLQKKINYTPELSKFPALPTWLTTRDMARIGQLMLQHGQWNSKQVVPADWIKTITSLVTPIMEINPPSERYYASGLLWGYGYLWWVWEDHHTLGAFTGAYSAMGNGGQYITVLPAIDLVVAHKGPFELADLNAGRGVGHQQFQAALSILTTARCRGKCP